MRIKLLGSGGGEGYPALFCGCEHCNAARKAGGKNLRSLSQALVDGKLLIDLPADTRMHFLQNSINFGEIEHVLITHVHDDHYCPDLFATRGTDFAPVLGCEKVHVYGNADVRRLFDGFFALFPIRDEIRENIVFHTLTPWQCVRVGAYAVTPLKANHDPSQTALNYMIDDGRSTLLYLLDTGYPTEETLAFLRTCGKKFDCVVMDSTMGTGYYERHMNFAEDKKLKDVLCESGACDRKTQFVISHITHNHAGSHEEIERYFAGSGIAVAYDGMQIETDGRA